MKSSSLIQRLLTIALLLTIVPVAPVAAAQSVACTSPITDSSTVEPIHMVFGGDIVLGNSYVVEHIPKDWEQRYFAGVRGARKSMPTVLRPT